MKILVLLLLLAALEPEQAEPQVLRQLIGQRFQRPSYALSELLAWQRRSYAGAVVTGAFHDPRGVSRYRSTPGLHLGYDIAMPAGTPARLAWAGTVVAVVPWAAGEWGVVVRHPDGSQATYGHVVPGVAPGATLSPGDTVGTIAVDHLDVKMRDARGTPVDFGQGTGPSRDELLARWWLARAEQAAQARRSQGARARLRTLEKRHEALPRALELGLYTSAQAERLRQEVRQLRAQVNAREVSSAVERQARAAGLRWEEVRALARRWGQSYPNLAVRSSTAPSVHEVPAAPLEETPLPGFGVPPSE